MKSQEEGSPKPFLSIPQSPPTVHAYIHDVLLGRSLRIKIFPSCTFDALRQKIQAAQIQHGLRLLPTHIQRLTVGGVEYAGTAAVYDVVRQAGPDIVVEPLVPELVSFFLAGVCDLREGDADGAAAGRRCDAGPARSDSEHVCFFGDMDDLSLDDGERGGRSGRSSGSSSRSSGGGGGLDAPRTPPGSSPARSPCLSPLLLPAREQAAEPAGPGLGLGKFAGRRLGCAQLPQPVLDALSGQVRESARARE